MRRDVMAHGSIQPVAVVLAATGYPLIGVEAWLIAGPLGVLVTAGALAVIGAATAYVASRWQGPKPDSHAVAWLDRFAHVFSRWLAPAGADTATEACEFHARATAVAEFIERHGPAEGWTAARWDEFENTVAYRTAVLVRESRGGAA